MPDSPEGPLNPTSGGPMPPVPPGWYQDPGNQVQLRYWDGTAWTTHTSPMAPPPPLAGAVPVTAQVPSQTSSDAVGIPTSAPADTPTGVFPPVPPSRPDSFPPAGPGKPFYMRWWAWAGAAVLLIFVIGVAVGASKSNTNLNDAASSQTTVQPATSPGGISQDTSPPQTSPPDTSPPDTSPPVTSPPVTAAPVTAPPVTIPPVTSPPPPGPAQASFSCTGSAPEGVDITYGTDSSNLSGGNAVPWQASLSLPSTALYANVTAQLQGPDGTISCTSTVTWSQDGITQTVNKTGTASGDYNIASAEICSNYEGGWQAC